jgi:uncharacterized membrane-anchored protein YhcB (DUF1043 family)
MDYNVLFQAIDTHGFPMVCVVVLGIFIYKIYQQSVKREERLDTQIDKFGESLDGFNTTLTKIDARLEVVEKHILEESE